MLFRPGKPGLSFGQIGGSLSTIAVVDRYEKAFGSVSEAHNVPESLQARRPRGAWVLTQSGKEMMASRGVHDEEQSKVELEWKFGEKVGPRIRRKRGGRELTTNSRPLIVICQSNYQCTCCFKNIVS